MAGSDRAIASVGGTRNDRRFQSGLPPCIELLAVVTLALVPAVLLMKRSVAQKGAHISHE